MSKAYTKYIKKNTIDSHQTSPHWLVTFTRFDNRDTQNYKGSDKITRKPLVVENDCITVSVSVSKTNHTPSATIVLTAGDLNYSTAVAPGDFVMINMVNSSEKARELRIRAGKATPQSINRVGDGFKGIFKINNVNEIDNVDPNTGQKTIRYQITAYGFTEFNNFIYYNPTLGNTINKDVVSYLISDNLQFILNSKKSIHEVLEVIPLVILGGNTVSLGDTGINSFKKTPYQIPSTVFKLMGLDINTLGSLGPALPPEYAIDLYKIMVGNWGTSLNKERFIKDGKKQYEDTTTVNTSDIKKGLNPSVIETGSIQTVVGDKLQGRIPIQTTSLVNVRLMDLLKRFSNDLINEMYTCFRVDEMGLVLPKLIIRQKPFNSEHGIKNNETGKYKQIQGGTKFLSLPRWNISPDLVYSKNISKNESLRFNFIHIIGTTGNSSLDNALMATQNAKNSTTRFDKKDIQRHGLRPYSKVSNFDWPESVKKGDKRIGYASHWSDLVFDWIHGGHLKLNGKITTVGIQDDICIGDNLELQGIVYHIEAISHTGGMSSDGRKTFRTSFTLSYGMDKRSNKNGPVYPEMDYTDTYLNRVHDYNRGDKVLPGFSDTQDILGREKGEEVKETGNKSYTPADLINTNKKKK